MNVEEFDDQKVASSSEGVNCGKPALKKPDPESMPSQIDPPVTDPPQTALPMKHRHVKENSEPAP
jgi:hypothetical protein